VNARDDIPSFDLGIDDDDHMDITSQDNAAHIGADTMTLSPAPKLVAKSKQSPRSANKGFSDLLIGEMLLLQDEKRTTQSGKVLFGDAMYLTTSFPPISETASPASQVHSLNSGKAHLFRSIRDAANPSSLVNQARIKAASEKYKHNTLPSIWKHAVTKNRDMHTSYVRSCPWAPQRLGMHRLQTSKGNPATCSNRYTPQSILPGMKQNLLPC